MTDVLASLRPSLLQSGVAGLLLSLLLLGGPRPPWGAPLHDAVRLNDPSKLVLERHSKEELNELNRKRETPLMVVARNRFQRLQHGTDFIFKCQ